MKTKNLFLLPTLIAAFGLIPTGRMTAQTCSSAPPGLVAWFKAEGSANDAIGSNNGTLQGGAGFSAGEVGQAFSFDGSDYLQVPHSPLWDFGTNEFTIELWANFNFTDGIQVFISCDDGSGEQNKWVLVHGYGVDGLTFHLNGTPGNLTIGNFPFSPVAGQWYHIALTRSGSAWTFYVSGAPIGTDTVTATVPTMGAPLTIGNAEGGFNFNGLEDEVSIYNRALSAAEIQAIYDAGSAGKCSPTQLTIVSSGAKVILTWPTNAAGFSLQSTTNLLSPSVWRTVSPTPVIVNGQNAVTNPISGTQQFYRLSQ